MNERIRDLSVTLLARDEIKPDDEFGEMDVYMACKCGTNCSVCSGTGSKPCIKIIDDEHFARLREMIART